MAIHTLIAALILVHAGQASAQSLESLFLGVDPSLRAAALAAGDPAPPPDAGEPKPAEKKDPPKDGPEAVLSFERSFRGPRNPEYKGCCHLGDNHAPAARRKKEDEAYPEAKPIPLAGLKNIVPMTRELWKPEDLIKDFERNKKEGQQAILVMVKSEACHLNEHRVCAVATAALEKMSAPALSKFRIYAAWIKTNPDQKDRAWQRWEEEVTGAYRFEQGPGAKLVVIIPGVGRPYDSSAGALGLTVADLEKNKGSTPRLETFLNEALESGLRLRR